jgi:23S rRNA-/tRNA-specific pseudouridylate synthase
MTEDDKVDVASLPLNSGVRLLAQNEDGLIALEKPAGALSHPNEAGEESRSILEAPYDLDAECYRWERSDGSEARAWLINRLDSPTSGVILLGLNEAVAEAVRKEFASRRVTKIYYALVRGRPKAHSGAWSDVLQKDIHVGKRTIKNGRAVKAKSSFILITSPTGGFPVSLLKLSPLTGRTHQLRVQCQRHGLPIVGDRTYGSFGFNKEVKMLTGVRRMLLHSAETHVNYFFKGKPRNLVAKSPLPREFEAVIDYRPGLKTSGATRREPGVLEGRRFKV